MVQQIYKSCLILCVAENVVFIDLSGHSDLLAGSGGHVYNRGYILCENIGITVTMYAMFKGDIFISTLNV